MNFRRTQVSYPGAMFPIVSFHLKRLTEISFSRRFSSKRIASSQGLSQIPIIFLFKHLADPCCPGCTQFQGEWIESPLNRLTREGVTYFEAKREEEHNWIKQVREVWEHSIFPFANNLYQGSNIPGKRVEALNWAGGLKKYMDLLEKSCDNGY